MKLFEISGKTGHSRILVGERLERVADYLPAGRTVVITDRTVSGLYGRAFPGADVITVGMGESIKTLETVADIYARLIELEADRTVFLLGIGGGIVCDINGFAASTYLRGVRFGYVPTTLLAQVDAGVGGKTGVNFSGYKNMVGVFSQPEFVLCDPGCLNTLPSKELSNGFAEVIKHAAIADAEYFAFLEDHVEQALALEPVVLERIIYDSVAVKAAVVNRDETEKGERRKLNFGHTLGHAIEKTAGLAHGEAVAVGMAAAARLSAARSMISQREADRLVSLLERFHLPVDIRLDKDKIFDALARDKKREGGILHLVLLSAIGKAVVEPVCFSDLDQLFE